MNRLTQNKIRWLLIAFLLWPSFAFAWGSQGHQTIALVAESLLTPRAKHMVDELRKADGWQVLKPGYSRYFPRGDRNLARFCLGKKGDLSLVADWADAWRERHPDTGRLHFINTPLDSNGTRADLEAACGSGCVVTKLEQAEQILADPNADHLARLESLLWVIHLAGDLHQPLHCADDHDKGGNTLPVWLMGRRVNLHWVWDTGLFHAERARPRELAKSLLEHECRLVPAGSSPDADTLWAWAAESFGVAKTFVYPQYQQNRGEFERADVERAWPVARLQLARAGVRLAALLNQAAR